MLQYTLIQFVLFFSKIISDLLTQEWIENIALRRIFFLEAAHFPLRYHELNKLEKDMDHRRTGVTETSVRIFDQPEDQNTNEHRHKDDNRNTNENKNSNHLNCQHQPTEMNESSNHVETEQQQHEISIDDFAVFNTQKNGNAIDIEEANSNRRLDDTINTEDLPQFITHPEIRETPPSELEFYRNPLLFSCFFFCIYFSGLLRRRLSSIQFLHPPEQYIHIYI